MEVSKPRIAIEDGYPYLGVTVAGKGTAWIFCEQPLRARFGLVYLGPEWEDRIPPLEIPADPPGRAEPETVLGFSNDATLLGWFDRMQRLDSLGMLQEGPLKDGD